MGKIRIKKIGDESAEEQKKKEIKEKREQKGERSKSNLVETKSNLAEATSDVADAKAQKTGEVKLEEAKDAETPQKVLSDKKEKKKSKATFDVAKNSRSKHYTSIAKLVEKDKVYSLSDGLSLLEKMKREKIDETVELHINTQEIGIQGTITLPHGTGKQTRVVIADEKVIEEIENGKITFDVLLAHPSIMPKLAKVARVLGPKGLMPNPKNGTITQNPDEALKKYENGQIRFKTEAKTPIIHLSVGKLSFGDKKLKENIQLVIASLPLEKIKNITLKSTMSPGIRLQVE